MAMEPYKRPPAEIHGVDRNACAGDRQSVDGAQLSDLPQACLIRSNFGHELYKGSNLGANAQNNTGLNPVQNLSEFNRYAALGEMGYVTADGSEAKRLIRKYPLWFFKLTRRRIDAFWNGPVDVTSMFEFNDAHLAFKKVWYAALSFAGLGGILVALLRRERFAFLFAESFCSIR